jgi:hypothetical protein
MFRSSIAKIRSWLTLADDDLLGEPEVVVPHHPHRRPLTYKPVRRHGAVPARPAVCVSPVRPAPGRRSGDAAAR